MREIMDLAPYHFLKKQACKPDSVESYHLSRHCITKMLNPPTLLYKASNLNLQIYLVFHHAEFTRFHYSLTVHTFCCTIPI